MRVRFWTVIGLVLGLCSQAGEWEDLSPRLKTLLESSPVPGIAAAAVVDGQIKAAGVAGVRREGAPNRVELSDRFHIGSCTKSMTAVLAAMFVRKGHLQWETTVASAFGPAGIHEDYRPVTLEQLLTNTGGVPGNVEPGLWGQLWQAKGSAMEQRLQLVNGILAQAPAAEPGRQFIYSNAGFSIAGAMIEGKAEQPFEAVLRTQLFEPLEMKAAGFRAPATAGKVDQPYGHRLEGENAVPVDPEPAGDNPRAIAPAGAVHCSVLDFARYAQFHLGKRGTELLSEEERNRLYQPASSDNYAFGWLVTQRPWAHGTALTHSGSNTMWFAVMWLAPERDFAAVVMCNLGGNGAAQLCDQAAAGMIGEYLD